MRYVAVTEGDKTEAELRFGVAVNTWGVNDLADGGRRRRRPPTSTRWSPSTRTATTSRPSCCPAASGTSRCATAAAIELGLRAFLERRRSTAFTTTFEDLGGLRQLPGLAVQRLMADGYGFGAEGDWKTAILVRAAKVMGAGLPGGASLDGGLHLRPGPGRGADPRRPHARGLPVADHGQADARDPPAGHRRARGPGPAGVHRRPRRRRRSWPCRTCATGSGCVANVVDVVPPPRRCPTCRWPARCGSRARTSRRRPSPG